MKQNLFETIKKIVNKQEFSSIEKTANKMAMRKANESGFSPIGTYNVEMRNVISNDVKTRVLPLSSKNAFPLNLLSKVQYIQNVQSNLKYPFVSCENVKWGIPTSNVTITSKPLKPYRLSAQVEISKTLLNSTSETFAEEFTNICINEIYSKVFETMFSDSGATDDNPSGLLYGLSAETINNVSGLTSIQKEVTLNTDNAIWLISTSAHAKINEINPDLFKDTTLLQLPYIITNKALEDSIICIDLNKVVLADFGILSITADPITKARDGIVTITFDAYFDFDIKSSDFISLGVFE